MRKLLPGDNWHGKDLRKRLLVLAVASFAIATLAHLVWYLRPVTLNRMHRSTVMVERRTWCEVTSGGRAVLFFSEMASDSSLTRLSWQRDSAVVNRYSAGAWVNRWILVPSCFGRVVTCFKPLSTPSGNVTALIKRERDMLSKRIRQIAEVRKEMAYYLRSHAASDDGFNHVASYNAMLAYEQQKDSRLVHVMDSILKVGVVTLVRHNEYTVFYRGLEGSRKSVTCRLIASDKRSGALLLRTHEGVTPIGTASVAVSPIASMERGDSVVAVGYGGISVKETMPADSVPVVVPGICNGESIDIPVILTGCGAPVYTIKGMFQGINNGRLLIGGSVIGRLFSKKEIDDETFAN